MIFHSLYRSSLQKKPGDLIAGTFFIQPKLTINQLDDVYEQEADAMADRVVQSGHNSTGTFFKPILSGIQKKGSYSEAKQQPEESHSKMSLSTDNYIGSLSGGNSLPQNEKQFFESRMGHDFSDVKLHTDTAANESAQSLGAKAYAHHNNIVFGANQYQPHTTEGRRLMAHELTHVVQQKASSDVVQRDEQKAPPPDRYEELKDDKKAKEIFEKLNPGVLGRYCTQNCPAVAEALEEYLKTGVFPETHCDPLGEGSYGYDVGDTEFSEEIVGWEKFRAKALPNLKKHGDFLVIEAHRTEKQAKENNLTEWHYFLLLNIRGKNFVVNAFTKEVNGNSDEYTTHLIASSYRYVKGDFKIKKVRVK